MKRALKFFAFGLLVAAFWPWIGNPADYVNWEDRFKTSIPIALVFGFPCVDYHEGYRSYDESPNCLQFSEPRRFKGIWLDQFEGSHFVEGVDDIPTNPLPYEERTFLIYDAGSELPMDGQLPDLECHQIDPYLIEFIGQKRTAGSNGAGHLGLFGSEVWVQKVLSIERVGESYCPPSSPRT